MSDKIAIMYDFDETLCTRNMQEYSLLPHLNLNPDEFWGSVVNLARTSNMDPTLAYMYLMIEEAKKRNYPIKREEFQKLGADIEYYPGVEDYFHKINEYGRSLGMQIQHFIISSGTKEIIEGCSIYDEFTKVFASEFHYDENGNADWPALAINYTGKTQFLFRINKNALEIYDSNKVNTNIAPGERDIPFDHMIYLGDGMTDVPCMRLVKANGGYSIGVYYKEKKSTVRRLLNEDRVNFALQADYRDGSELMNVLHDIIGKIAAEDRVRKYTKTEID
ncbi:MAG: haloacid dehalogenase-like hydrolase [Erysipelotrichaceae bacterium]|nr:haloacid dehalogenase-like hydrolase [Erysipelotrichaceae bacterium]